MSARRLCVVVYGLLAEGRDADGLAELDAMLEPQVIDRRSAFAVAQARVAALAAGGEVA